MQNTKKALFIGLTTIDIQYFVEHYPQANTKLKTDSPLIAVGGPAANAAIAYSVLGGQADFLTCIGKHTFTTIVKDDLARYNVGVIDPMEDQETDAIVSAVITTLSNSERTIITHHPQALNHKELQLPDIHPEDYELIFIDGFYPELSRSLLPEARKLNIPVVFDGGSWKPHLPDLLKSIDVAICSGNFHPPGCSTDQEIITFLKAAGIKEVAISKGEESIVCENTKIAIDRVEAVDSLGAGDVLHGAFCWYWLNTKNFTEALANAAKVASFSVQFRGTHQWISPYQSGDLMSFE